MGKNRFRGKTPKMSKKKSIMKRRQLRLEILKQEKAIHQLDSSILYRIKTSRTETKG